MLDDNALRRRITAILSAGGIAILSANCATTDTGNRPSTSDQYTDESTEKQDGDAERDERKFEDLNRPLYSVEETD